MQPEEPRRKLGLPMYPHKSRHHNTTHHNPTQTYAIYMELNWATVRRQVENSDEGCLSPTQLKAAGNAEDMAIIMEWCDRGTLSQAIRHKQLHDIKGSPRIDWLFQCAYEIASAMTYMHSLHLVHGDLKPGNIMLKSTSTEARGFILKVADFGMSRLLSEGRSIVTETMGTYAYMPPELVKDHKLSTKMDVYSFGVILWELYTGRVGG